MNFMRKNVGQMKDSIINIGRLNFVEKKDERLSIEFKMFNENQVIVWTYDDENQLESQYHRLLHVLQIKHNNKNDEYTD